MPKQEASDICATLVEQTDKLISDRIAKAQFDKTYIATITEVLFNNTTISTDENYEKYNIYYNCAEQPIYIKDGKIHSVGDRLLIVLPLNNPRNKQITVLSDNIHPSKIKWVDSDNKIIETWTNNTGQYIERTYEFIIENKGEQNELVKTMIFPDGSTMDLSEFVAN